MGFFISLAAAVQSYWDIQMNSCPFPAQDLSGVIAIGTHLAQQLQSKHFPPFQFVGESSASSRLFFSRWFSDRLVFWSGSHLSSLRVRSGNIANTFDQQALLAVAIWQKCHRTVSLSFLPHHKICTFSLFSTQCNTDLPHPCSSYNHSCHNQTYYKIIRLIRVTLQ